MSQIFAINGEPSQAEMEFQEKMKDRLRQSIGDLMPDAVLQGVVTRGIEEAFFQPRERKDRWGVIATEPCWFHEFIQEETSKHVKVAVEQWVAENQEKMQNLVKETLQDGLVSAVLRALDSLTRPAMESLIIELAAAAQKLSNR